MLLKKIFSSKCNILRPSILLEKALKNKLKVNNNKIKCQHCKQCTKHLNKVKY